MKTYRDFIEKSDDFWFEIAKFNCYISLTNMQFTLPGNSADMAGRSVAQYAEKLEKFVDNYIKRHFELEIMLEKDVNLAPRLLDRVKCFLRELEAHKDTCPNYKYYSSEIARVVHKVLTFIKSKGLLTDENAHSEECNDVAI